MFNSDEEENVEVVVVVVVVVDNDVDFDDTARIAAAHIIHGSQVTYNVDE